MRSEIDSGQTSIQRDAPIAFALAAGFLWLYLRTLCPTVYLGDSGEICTAIATGGVAHPPGYPLFSLLGRAALTLIPWGEPAFRIGCLVAAAAAGAVVALYFVARELGCSPWASACGAATLGASYSFWSQSTRVEVYSLHVFLAGLLLLSALRYRRTGNTASLAAVVLAGSLGLAHHLTIVLLGPAALLLGGRRLWCDPGRARRLALVAGLLPVGPALYLFLMRWARAAPLQEWGHPVTLALLWNHASGHIFRIFLAIPDGPTLLRSLARVGTLFADNFPSLLFLLPLAGAGVLWKRDRGIAAGLLLVVLAVCLYNACYQIPDIACYYLTAWMVSAALLPVAMDAARGRLRGRAQGPATAGLTFALLLGAPLLRNWNACNLSGATWMREFARQKLESAAPGSVLLIQGDDDTNPIWYVHDVLKVRPDVIPIDRAQIGGRTWGLYDYDPSLWYLYRLRRQGVPAPIHVPRDPAARSELCHDGYLVQLLGRELRQRPLCTTFMAPGTRLYAWMTQRFSSVPMGVVLRLSPIGRPVDLPAILRQNERLWAQIRLPDLRQSRTDQEYAPDYVTDHYARMMTDLGILYERKGDLERAAAVYRRAAAYAPRYQPAAAALAAVRQTARLQGLRLSTLPGANGRAGVRERG